MPPLCRVDVTAVGPVRVATLIGELDLSNVGDIENQLAAGLRSDSILVVDLAQLAYVDSSGLGMLDRLSRHTKLRLVVPDGAVIFRTLRVTGLDQLVPTFATRDAALTDLEAR